MTKTANTNEIIAAILEQNNKLIAILEQSAASVTTETTAKPKAAKPKAKPAKAAKPKAKAETVKLTKTQERVISGVMNRAAKHGYELRYYVQGSWVWFENTKANQTYKTRNGEVKFKDTTEQFASLPLSTKSTKLEYSARRGQFTIKDFIKSDK